MKRGQITIYIIIGVVILVSVVLLFYFKNSIFQGIQKEKQVEITSVPEQFKEIQKQIQDCADKFVLDSIYNLGIYGGYLDRTNLNTINYLNTNLTYLHYGKKSYVPAITVMERELMNNINNNLPYACRLTDKAININFGKVSSIVDVKTNTIVVKITWPIKLKKDTMESELSDISLSYPIRLGEIRNLVDVMVKQQINDKPQLCLTCMARTASDNNLFINTYNQDTDIIFLVTDMKQVKDFELYKFWYVGDYK